LPFDFICNHGKKLANKTSVVFYGGALNKPSKGGERGPAAQLLRFMAAGLILKAPNTPQMTYVVVDIETTGLSKNIHKITEIAGIKTDKGRVVDEFNTLINPEVKIPSFITHLTGINNNMVKDAPVIDDVMPGFCDFLGDSVFVAHNATFDYGFLSVNAEFAGLEFGNKRLCTRKLATRLVPMLESKRLAALCQHFRIINEKEHRAMGDARATLCVFNNFQAMLKKMGVKEKRDIIRFERSSKKDIIERYGASWLPKKAIKCLFYGNN